MVNDTVNFECPLWNIMVIIKIFVKDNFIPTSVSYTINTLYYNGMYKDLLFDQQILNDHITPKQE